MSSRTDWTTITFTLIVLIAVIGGLYLNQSKETVVTETTELEATGGCDPVQQVCKAGNNSIELQLHFPKQPVYLASFPVAVTMAGNETIAVDAVVVDFQMTGMDMGINKTALSKVTQSDKQHQQVWTGNMTLPVCITGRVDWQALVQITAGQNRYQASFPVKVEKAVVNSN